MVDGLLFIDTESSDLPKYYGALTQAGQARVCQVAMLLTDLAGNSIAQFSALIKPEGWVIMPGAQAAHGFSLEACEKWGVSGKAAYAFFARTAAMASKVIAHNSEFDEKMMRIEAAHYGLEFPATPWDCTMKMASDFMNMKPTQKMLAAGFNKPKPPKLEEALQAICGRSLGETAHNAIYDVEACAEIYFKLNEKMELTW